MTTVPMPRVTSTAFAFLMVLLLGLMGPGESVVSAQAVDARSYTTASGSHEIAWKGEWEIADDPTIEPRDAEAVVLLRESASFVVAFPKGEADLAEVRDSLLQAYQSDDGVDQLETIDAGEYNGIAYALDRANRSGEDVGVFTLVVDRGPGAGTVVTMMVAPAETFGTDLQSAQAEITVDQEESFTGIDPQGLQKLLGTSASQTSAVTPEPTAATTTQPTAAPTTRPTVAAAPTSTQTVEQPTGGITSQEEAYFAAINDDSLELATIMNDFSALFTLAGQNPSLIYDSTWQVEVAGVLYRWQVLSEDMREHNPSPRQQNIQEMWLEISTSNLRAIDLIVQGIDNLDVEALTRGTACINYSTAVANDLTKAIYAFYDDPNAPFQRQYTLSPGSTCESFSN